MIYTGNGSEYIINYSYQDNYSNNTQWTRVPEYHNMAVKVIVLTRFYN